MLNKFYVMNASNPFQIPSCLHASLLQRKRERFKQSVLVVVAGTTLLLAVLLILGCNSEHSLAASVLAVDSNVSATTPDTSIAASATEPKLVSDQTSPVPSLIASSIVSKEGATVQVNRPVTIYVVKPADTLSRIAKAHGITVNALKVANGLDGDRIGIGMKLKLPEA